MNFIKKIEALINKSINKFINNIIKIIPKKIKNIFNKRKDKKSHQTITTKDDAPNFMTQLASIISVAINKSIRNLNKAVSSISNIDFKIISYKRIRDIISQQSQNIQNILKAKYNQLGTPIIIAAAMMFGVTITVSIMIYNTSYSIKKKNMVNVDNSDAQHYNKKSSYYKLPDKQILVQNITLPVYIEGGNAIKSLRIDFILESSNRYIKTYLYKNEFILKNKLNTTIETIIPNFPLTVEGKDILKYKIQKETNDLLKKMKIKGHIKHVFFQSIVAG